EQQVAPAQEELIGFRAGRERLFYFLLLLFGKFQFQPRDDALGDRVLQRDQVARVRVDLLAPQYLAGGGLDQLGCDAKAIGRFDGTPGEDYGRRQVFADPARIDILPGVLGDVLRRAHHQRAHARKLGDDAVGQREFVEIILGVAGKIFERQHRNGLFVFAPPTRRPGRGRARRVRLTRRIGPSAGRVRRPAGRLAVANFVENTAAEDPAESPAQSP